MLRGLVASFMLAVGLLVNAGCAEEPSDPLGLDSRVAAVDQAIVAEDFGEARARISALLSAVEASDLDADTRAAIRQSAQALLAKLPQADPSPAPSPEPTLEPDPDPEPDPEPEPEEKAKPEQDKKDKNRGDQDKKEKEEKKEDKGGGKKEKDD